MTRLCDTETFISAWQSSNTVKEVAAMCGITYRAAVNRACNYRKRGILLKKYPTYYDPQGHNWDHYRDLAHDH